MIAKTTFQNIELAKRRTDGAGAGKDGGQANAERDAEEWEGGQGKAEGQAEEQERCGDGGQLQGERVAQRRSHAVQRPSCGVV